VVVDSERIDVQIYRKTEDGGWPRDGEHVSDGGVVTLTSIGAEFAVAEIYAGTRLGVG